MFQFGAFQFGAFQMAVVSAAGKAKKKARELTRLRQRADVLAEKYNKAREQSRVEAEKQISEVVNKFTAEEKRESLPPAVSIDFAALAANRKAVNEFLTAIENIQKAIIEEEEEIFQFIMSIA